MTKMIAEDMEDIARLFETYASDQIAMKSRYTTKKEKLAADIRAQVWASAAQDIRNIEFIAEFHINALRLCQDEGCPHHGTPHECITTPATPVAIEQDEYKKKPRLL